MQVEVAIVGGSFAGLAAAMQLVRGRRSVVVIDAAKPRNRFAAHSHGIFCLDGKSPAEINATAIAQLQQYPKFTLMRGEALSVERQSDRHFVLQTTAGDPIVAQKLILATGLQDELPDIEGLAKHWGKSAVHCPYCHGYELADRELGVLATSALSVHQALMIPDWGKTTLFTQKMLRLDDEQLSLLSKRGVSIEHRPIVRVNGVEVIDSVTLADGTERHINGLYVTPKVRVSNPLVSALQCELVESPLGDIIQVDEFKQTSVADVYAAGDISNPMQNGSLAITSGVMAGISAHQSLMFA